MFHEKIEKFTKNGFGWYPKGNEHQEELESYNLFTLLLFLDNIQPSYHPMLLSPHPLSVFLRVQYADSIQQRGNKKVT